MAQEIKNTFLKSKMNKDLDDRILPNGEYRDARNISVGRSEDNNVGALENIIGNNLVTGTDIGANLTIIGILNDNSNDKLFLFLTDYTDADPANPTNAPSTSKHYIYSYNNASGDYSLLVQGEFLNFSKTNPIIGINLIEDLLFWTDNRNQPRKINVNLAVAFEAGTIAAGDDYYTAEHQISVAKYNPYQSINLYNRADLQVLTGATTTVFEIDGHRRNELLPLIGATVTCFEALSPTFGTSFVKVVSIANSLVAPDTTIITVSPALNSAPTAGQFVTLIGSTMSNENDNSSWPGDPDYLENKFVRFSYRFKFDDNEYSLMAPFTQIAYIPKQNGYFINGDEDAAYQSTVLEFMENLVQNVGLIIPLPCSANNLVSHYKINEVEILFRESDGIAAKVLESVSAGEISGASGIDNYYTYEYQSRKPYRTLPEAQTVRVYDKVPVRALAQETAGNRIIYGNFIDKQTPPDTINYNCRIADKSSTGVYNNFIEYPNSSVKRNRNYQVGFVLADKFGRQSPVILSSVDIGTESSGQFYSGSTIYSPYDLNATDTDVDTWFGDAIQVLVNEPITSQIDSSSGTPGLYAIEVQYSPNTGEGFAISNWTGGAITDTTWTFRLDPTYTNNANIPRAGDYLRGAYEDFVEVESISGPTGPSQYTVTTKGRVSESYYRTNNPPVGQPDLRFAYSINDLGWYSYKIVVKQTEQEYYNVYLPGILNGYPGQSDEGDSFGLFPTNELNLTAHTVLFNDNINKIPRDLAEVGPDQKKFRSSVVLYGRVSNLMYLTTSTGTPDPGNAQYYARLNATGKNAIDHTAVTIADASELNMNFKNLSENPIGSGTGGADGNLVFYQIDANPLIARISTTEKSIGWDAERTTNPTALGGPAPNQDWNMQPFLAVYETAPVESNLDLYWETTSEGLIVDLNTDIASGNSGVAGFENVNWEFLESDGAGTAVTGFFTPINNEGQTYVTAPTGQLISVIDGLGVNINFFELEVGAVGTANEGKFRINYTGQGIVFDSASAVRDVYTFVIKMTTSDGDVSQITIGGEVGGVGALKNAPPSFSAIGNITTRQDTVTIIPAASFSASANGTILTGAPSKEGLVYSFSGAGLPDNWVMNPSNGALTQAVPGDIVGTDRNFSGNAIGSYNVELKLTDASGVDTNNTTDLYAPLISTENIVVKIDYSLVNSEAVSTSCVLQPSSSAAEAFHPTVFQDFLWYPISRIYYIAQNSLDYNDFFTNGIENPQLEPGTQFLEPIFRIGTGAHTKGAIAITSNIYAPPNPLAPAPGQGTVVGIPDTEIYFRFTGDTTWRLLERSNEYNKVGLVGNGVKSPAFDKPNNFTNNVPSTPPEQYLSNGSAQPSWLQAVRAVDYNSFSETNDGIEYAILVKNLLQRGPNMTLATVAKAWVAVDDLHYPACVPWQGVNAITANAGNPEAPYFKYFRSTGSNNSQNYVDLAGATDIVYSRNPYGDYVDQFYTDIAGLTTYKPASGLNYINFALDRAVSLPTLTPWTTLALNNLPSTDVNLQWVAGFDDSTGKKIFNTGAVDGVSAIQTTNNLYSAPSSGTLRVANNQ